MLAALAAVLSVIVLCACSDPSARREDVAQTNQAVHPVVLGPLENDWRLPPSGDFNHDGMQDVLWRNHPSNLIAVSLMDGTRVLEQGPLIPGPPGDGWIVADAFGDFDLDGMADILWYNTTTHRMTVWLMHGTEPFVRGAEIEGPPGDGWICVAGLDFNRDGMDDVLWSNPVTNRWIVWLMHGTEPFATSPEIPGAGEGWIAAFGADFDFDGQSDLFWYDPTGHHMAIWLMEGSVVRERGPAIDTPGPGFVLTAAADFNRDLLPDELWFDSGTGRMTTTLMRGTALLERGPDIPGPTGPGWIAGNAADCDGDGMFDVLWLNTDPLRMKVWLMNGTVPVVQGPDIPGPSE